MGGVQPGNGRWVLGDGLLLCPRDSSEDRARDRLDQSIGGRFADRALDKLGGAKGRAGTPVNLRRVRTSEGRIGQRRRTSRSGPPTGAGGRGKAGGRGPEATARLSL